ncbi:hypothetical protein [Marinifilum sp. D714]|uniref:hypothetical protein n=1 Tax=Marinifilum sp. D714 TaxID=2937523 RepID=UPI0027C81976|nr:hypothetical protein [Marinifilum sp. D714]MDQ2180468.1 hypothetical protein [Marinifilum sp. D714]
MDEKKEMNNKNNILWFENESMKGLFDELQSWQLNNKKRFLSTEIQRDNGKFCCIALTNPTEVTLVDDEGYNLSGYSANPIKVKIGN